MPQPSPCSDTGKCSCHHPCTQFISRVSLHWYDPLRYHMWAKLVFSGWQEALFPPRADKFWWCSQPHWALSTRNSFFPHLLHLQLGWRLEHAITGILCLFFFFFLLEELIWDLASVISGSPHALPFLAIGRQRGCRSCWSWSCLRHGLLQRQSRKVYFFS